MEPILGQRSQVVLFCLPLSRARGAVPPNAKSLSVLFSTVAKVQKVLIFKRKGMMKAFIQFSSSEEASIASQFLNGLYLNEHGKMQIYPAQLTEIAPASAVFDLWERSKPKSSGSSESNQQADSRILKPPEEGIQETLKFVKSLHVQSKAPSVSRNNQNKNSSPNHQGQNRGQAPPAVLPSFCSGYPLPPTPIYNSVTSRAFSAPKHANPSLDSKFPQAPSLTGIGIESYTQTSTESGTS